MKLENAQGQIFYGLHFYSGLAEYQEEQGQAYRVYLNEDTLRKMDPTFAGKPIFVEHVEEVDPSIDVVKHEADGWVIESFYNSADGKHWVKFIVVSEHGLRAIKNGMRLSNAYIPKSFSKGGLWNGIAYQKEITSGEYEHLAIVSNPRYEESVILNPEEFKKYNEDKIVELKKLSNSKSEKGKKMGFNIFKKTKVENSLDLSELLVVLPKSGRTVSVQSLVQNAYEKDEDPAMGNEDAKSHAMANVDHLVKMHDGSMMKVKDMMNKFKQMCDDIDDMKGMKKDSKEEEMDMKAAPAAVDVEGDEHNEGEEMNASEAEVGKEEMKEEKKDSLEHPEEPVHDAEDPSEDKDAKKKALELAEHEDKEIEEAKAKNKKKNEAAEKAAKLKNANERAWAHAQKQELLVNNSVDLSSDMVARGRQRYGSN